MRTRITTSFPRSAILALSTALLLQACGGPAPTAPPSTVDPGTPVVFISIDTLRSDRLPAYGYTGVETPAIDAVRRDAILFENAYSHYPLTLPSHASIFTGLLPTEHGVRDNVGYRLDAPNLPFLPRFLKERGYQLGAAVSAYILRADTGIGEGFDFYEDSFSLRASVSLGQNQRPGSETVKRAVSWLESVSGKPFFLFVHLYDPHTPYQPPEPFRSRYSDPYDGEIAAADAAVGQLTAALKRLGVYDRALVVLFSDHGEGLSDHGEAEHGILLYREALQVPLLLKLPGGVRAGTSVAAPAQLIDLAPTVEALLGEPREQTSLLDLLAPEPPVRPVYSETYYPRLHFGWSELTSLVDDGLHYIEGPDPELYDLDADPGETKNVLNAQRSRFWELRDRMATLETELEAPADVDEETRDRLAALGYLATTVAPTDGPLADPKSELHVLDDLTRASMHQSKREYSRAIELYRRVLEENSGLVDAWENLAKCLHSASRFDEAIEAYDQALELSRGADHVALSASRLYLEMERFDDARQHAELALVTNPAMAHLTLARIALASGDVPTALEEAERSLAARPNAVGPYLVQAQAAVDQGDLDRAAEHVARAEREDAKRQDVEVFSGLFYLKGHIAARRGEVAEAEAAFRREIRHHPDDTRVYSELALLYALGGRTQEAVDTLRTMVETLGTPAAYAAAVETLRVLGDPRSANALLGAALRQFPDNAKLTGLAEGS